MIKTDLYLIRFSYPDKHDSNKTKPGTSSHLYTKDDNGNWELYRKTTVRCNTSDNFSKDKGRRAALTKLLKATKTLRVDRKEIWDNYNKMTNFNIPNGK